MPNIGSMLKDEIARLSRREIRRQVETIRKASSQYRRNIAALKREVAGLRKQMSRMSNRPPSANGHAAADDTQAKTRFVARGLRSHRQRLGLSANEYGALVGVSAQSVYNWEQGLSRPRASQRAMLISLRGIGKREAQARLEQLQSQSRKANGNGRVRKRRARKRNGA